MISLTDPRNIEDPMSHYNIADEVLVSTSRYTSIRFLRFIHIRIPRITAIVCYDVNPDGCD
jgi:hypothetical protein